MINPQHIRAIEKYLQTNLPGYLDILRQMVSINSFTANRSGVNRLGNLTAEVFAEIGFSSESVPSTNGTYGDHLILTRKSDDGRNRPSICIVSHLDTVFPESEERQNRFFWREEGDRIFGPGTVDIKGGTVMILMILSALAKFEPNKFAGTDWYIMLNASEEVLADDFGQLCTQRVPSTARGCLVFEGGRIVRGNYAVVTARKGMATFHIASRGRASHAGSSHDSGANAIVQMADTVTKIAALTDYDRQITFNVGTVAGGTVMNRVPHLALASGEARAFDPKVLDEGVDRLLDLASSASVYSVRDNYPCSVDIEIMGKWEPWPKNPRTQELAEVWKRAGTELGAKVVFEHRGGLSDGNHTWRHMPTLDGLGPSGGNAHCSERSNDGTKDQEFVRKSSFVPKALLNIASIIHLLEQDLPSN